MPDFILKFVGTCKILIVSAPAINASIPIVLASPPQFYDEALIKTSTGYREWITPSIH